MQLKINECKIPCVCPELTVRPNGNKEYRLRGKLHREDGPAFEGFAGDKSWYINGKLHREDGPAVETANGYKAYYLSGLPINCNSEEEFMRIAKLKILI
jgi:hypothetical protein